MSDHHNPCCSAHALSRRGLLKMALIGGAAAALPFAPARAAGTADALLLSCMDYRLVDDIVRYMDGRGMTNNYDHAVLAGASLGAVSEKLNWGKTFWDHLEVAIRLHHIKKVIVLDHKDCGAYRVVFERDFKGADETAIHAEQLRTLKTAIQAKHPQLAVELLIMDLDGTVSPVEV
jgi:hypothetical protein